MRYGVAEGPADPFTTQQVPGVRGWPRLLLGPGDQPIIVFSSFDPQGSFATLLRDGAWSTPEPIVAHRFDNDAALDEAGSLHVIFDVVWEYEEDEGVWYTSNRSGSFEAQRIHVSTRLPSDDPGASSALAVDHLGRAHILFTDTFDEGRDGLWYAIGPGD